MVSGGNFHFSGAVTDRVFGTAEPDGVTFVLDPWGDGYYTIIERVTEDLQLHFGGMGEVFAVTQSPTGLVGTISTMTARRLPTYGELGSCRLAHLSFVRT